MNHKVLSGLLAFLIVATVAYATMRRTTEQWKFVNGIMGAGTNGNEFTLNATGTNTASFIGKDAAGAANTLLDTTGAGAITVGSADVTSTTVTTDGGSVVLDGSITQDAGTTLFMGGVLDATGAVDMDYGSADITDHTFTTDGTGNAEVVLPDSSVGQDEVAGMMMQVLLCGQLANNGTVYMSPVSGFPEGNMYDHGAAADSWQIGGDGCDAEDNATEGTADEVMYPDVAFKVLGMFCKVSSSGSNGVTLNLRSATADLTPDITITIATGTTGGATATTTTTDVAAGATFALKTVTTEDLSAQDAWCIANVMLQP